MQSLTQQGGNNISAVRQLGIMWRIERRLGEASEFAQTALVSLLQGRCSGLYRRRGLIVVSPVFGGFEDERAEIGLVLIGSQGVMARFQRRHCRRRV